MHGPILNYITSEIEYIDDRKNAIIQRKLSYSDKHLNTNYRKMTYSRLDKNLHRQIHECIIYSDDFEFIKKCMFTLFEIYEFKEGVLFLFSKIGNGNTALSIFEKGYGYPIFIPSDSDLLYTITTDTRKQHNVQPLPNIDNNYIDYSEFDKEFERQKKAALEKQLLEKQRQLVLKEQELRDRELKHKEFLLKEQQLLDLKKQELAVLELEQQKKAFEEKQLQNEIMRKLPISVELQQNEQELKEKENFLLSESCASSRLHQKSCASSRFLVNSKSNPKIVVVKVSKKNYEKKITPRRSPRLMGNKKKRFSF
jgi:hypothetical protein